MGQIVFYFPSHYWQLITPARTHELHYVTSQTQLELSLFSVPLLLNPKLLLLRAVSYSTLYSQSTVGCLVHSKHSVNSGRINECSMEEWSGTLLEYKHENIIFELFLCYSQCVQKCITFSPHNSSAR